VDDILMVLGGILGAVVPVLFAFALNSGVSRGPLDEAQKRAYRTWINSVMLVWTAAVWGTSLAGVVTYHAGDAWPRVAIPLFVPVIVAVAMLLQPGFRTVVDNIPLSTLVGVQIFRLAGFVFLIIPRLGHLPAIFVTGGYGDIATGALALLTTVLLVRNSAGAKLSFVLFSAVGLGDLLNVAALLFYYYPSWNSATLSSAALADFSLVMVPALAAPIALILHLYAIKNAFIRGKN
jgi:hypothetical protein